MSDEADLEFIALTCPQLEAIDLNSEVSPSWWFLPTNGLYGLVSGGGLSKLSKVSLRGIKNVVIDRWLHKLAHNLTYLELGYCSLVDDNAVEGIGQLCTCLSYLNLETSNVSDNGLRFLAHGRCSKTLKTLVFAHCSHITDLGLSHLRNMNCLEELDLRYCGTASAPVTDIGVIAAISGSRSLKKLNLRRSDVSEQTMVFVSENCPNLEFLDLTSSNVTGAGIRALSNHRCLESLVWRTPRCKYIYFDIEMMVLGCQSLKSVVLSHVPYMYFIPERVKRIVTFVFVRIMSGEDRRLQHWVCSNLCFFIILISKFRVVFRFDMNTQLAMKLTVISIKHS